MSDYVPKPDVEGINAPDPAKHNRLHDLAILLGGFLSVVFVCVIMITMVFDWAFQKISIQSEIRFLGGLWDDVAGKEKSKDFNDFVGLINKQVYFPLRVSIFCSKEPNAFTLPGGKIFFTSGLLEKVESENGLAFILGHEVGHIIHRDHLRGVAHSLAFGITSSVLGLERLGGVNGMSQLVNSAFDRAQENAADDYGLEILRKTYGHTFGAEELFAVLEKDENKTTRAFARIISTHPPSKDRIERIRLTQAGSPKELKTPSRPFSDWVKDSGCTSSDY